MRPQLLKVSKEPHHSFSVRQDKVPCINNRWHYHPEIELIHIKNGGGTQYVGDSIREFNSGDVVLIGPNLPHYWRFDDVYFVGNSPREADIRVAHFTGDFWGEKFLQIPENHSIRTLLEKSKRGIQVLGNTSEKVGELLETLLITEGVQRLMLLMGALSFIAESKQQTILSSIGFKQASMATEDDRINTIYDYSLKNFKRPIQLEEIAHVANISTNSFCRYFKSRTRKTYSQFMIEVRVGHACKLLIENNLSIKQLCYESGFNNFTSFHKYFKVLTGKSPLKYQREFIEKQ